MHVTAVWSHGRTYHRHTADMLSAGDRVRYRRNEAWFTVLRADVVGPESQRQARVQHVAGADRWLSPRTVVDVIYGDER